MFKTIIWFVMAYCAILHTDIGFAIECESVGVWIDVYVNAEGIEISDWKLDW